MKRSKARQGKASKGSRASALRQRRGRPQAAAPAGREEGGGRGGVQARRCLIMIVQLRLEHLLQWQAPLRLWRLLPARDRHEAGEQVRRRAALLGGMLLRQRLRLLLPLLLQLRLRQLQLLLLPLLAF